MKFRQIHAEKDHHEVSPLTRVLGVSRQGYYAWAARQRRGPSARARRDAELTEQTRRHHRACDEIYGAPRIHADLRELDGIRVGRKRVTRLMRAAGLAGGSRRRGCRTTIADRRWVAASDLVKQKFTTAEPNQVWTADITYVPTWQGFAYLAVVLDVFSRRIVGWATADHMRTELVTGALAMALHQRRPAAGVIHHSDKGSQGRFNWSSQHLYRLWPAMRAGGRPTADGPYRDLLRQRDHRELFRLTGMRADRSADLPCQVRSRASPVQLHRGLLQPTPPPHRQRPAQPGRLRTPPRAQEHPSPRLRCSVVASPAVSIEPG